MDPITAAGIGLSITSLVLQVFAGCLKGYQLFSEAEGMPASYHHLRVRLRIEQARLLNWGEKIGLVEELLDRPSQTLRLNRNLILDILLDVQRLFKDCVKITAKYDALVPEPPIESSSSDITTTVDRRFPKGTNRLLQKTLGILEKAPQAPSRLKWAMIKQENFSKLIEKLIGYNDSIESILDRSAVDQLQLMQMQTHMIMLQLTSKVDELKDLSLAMQVRSEHAPGAGSMSFSRSSTLVADTKQDHASFAALADFKARQTTVESDRSKGKIVPLERKDMQIEDSKKHRSSATYQQREAWVEWKEYTEDANPSSDWFHTIESRVQKLAILLGSSDKPKEFRAPQCLGYFDDRTDDHTRFGFVYDKPSYSLSSSQPTSLLELFASPRSKPSLTKRIALAHAISQSLMYLHSVNWLHKGFRSDSIIFFLPSTSEKPSLDFSNPILSGFDYARPDLPEEITERPSADVNHELYRHPDKIGNLSSRSKKSHDIYSLGVVLVEIAYWQSITTIMGIDTSRKGARSMVRKIRDRLLGDDDSEDKRAILEEVESNAGEMYVDIVRICLEGGSALGLPPGNADETDAKVGAEMQRVFSEEIVGRLAAMRV